MNNQKGFTLIELVVVIVILGILSAVAVPKFVDMQDEAKEAALNGSRGAVKSAVALVHAKWLVNGQTSPVSVEGASIPVDAYGYPTAANNSIMTAAGITDDFELNGNTITRLGAYSTSSGDSYWGFTYTDATDADNPPVVSALAKTTVP